MTSESLSTQGRNPLLIPDTLQSILDCIPQDPDVERQQTLFALAQTCRSTSEPSLDRLWRKLVSLHPLIRCARPIERDDQDVEQNDQDTEVMKQNAEEDDEDNEEEDENSAKDDQASEGEDQDSEGGAEEVEDSEEDEDSEDGELEELDPPTPAEWAVIERYSHRIQELAVLQDGLSLSFLKSAGSQPSPLFPNLKVLTWNWETNYPRRGSIARIYPLLSPTLITLQARLGAMDGRALQSFLKRYPHYCRNLKTVSLAFPFYHVLAQTTIYELSRAVCSHDKLVDLRIFEAPIDDAAMRQLSLSPTIESLSVYHYPQKPIPRPYFQPEDTPLRHLRVFRLATSDLDFFTTLLGSRDQSFSTLLVEVREQPTAEALSTFFSMLASSSSYTESIRTLLFDTMPRPVVGESRAEEEPHVFHLSYQSLLPLMSFSHLHTLQVFWSDQISLDDNEFAHLARSWPSMEILKICSKRPLGSQPIKCITCGGLLQLIISCPKLRQICLPLDAREVPTDTDPDVRNTVIDRLCFHEPRISDPSEVASFIRKHFPSVSSVAAKFSGRAVDDALWSEVDDLVKLGR